MTRSLFCRNVVDENEGNRVASNESAVWANGIQMQWRLGTSQHYKLQTDSSKP